jgi:hypothetical protein
MQLSQFIGLNDKLTHELLRLTAYEDIVNQSRISTSERLSL